MSDKFVAVRWLDSAQKIGWLFENELPEPKGEPIVTCGTIVREGPEGIVVASSVTVDRVFGGVTVIPRAAICSIINLEETKA
jgi:hypothetical protein